MTAAAPSQSTLFVRLLTALTFAFAAFALAPAAAHAAVPVGGYNCTAITATNVCVVDVSGQPGNLINMEGTNFTAIEGVVITFSDGTKSTYYRLPEYGTNPAGSSVQWGIASDIGGVILDQMGLPSQAVGYFSQVLSSLGINDRYGQALLITDPANVNKTMTSIRLLDSQGGQLVSIMTIQPDPVAGWIAPGVSSVGEASDTITIGGGPGFNAVDRVEMSCASLNLSSQLCPGSTVLRWVRPGAPSTAGTTAAPNEVISWTDTRIVIKNAAMFPGSLLKSFIMRKGSTTVSYVLPSPILLHPRIDTVTGISASRQYTITGATFGRLAYLSETFEDGTVRLVQKPGSAQPNPSGVSVQTWLDNPSSQHSSTITVTDTALAGHKLTKIGFWYLNSAGVGVDSTDYRANLYFIGSLTAASSPMAGQLTLTGIGLQAVTKVAVTLSDGSVVTITVPEGTGSFTALNLTSAQLYGKTVQSVTATIADGQTMTLGGLSVFVKAAAPAVAISSPTAAQIVNPVGPKATFALSGGAAATVTCQIDALAAKACTSPADLNALAGGTLAAGSHKLTVLATGADGQTGTASVTFQLAAMPTVAITSGPADGATTGSSVSYGFTATGAISTSCQIDSGVIATCTSPKDLTAQTVGSHTFKVLATDAFGNTVTSTPRTFTVIAAPTLSAIGGTPVSPTTATSATLSWTVGGGAATASCTIDSAASPCTSPASFINLTPGDHTFVVKLVNAAGTATQSATWHIAATPTVNFTAGPAENAATGDGTALTWAGSAAATSATCQLDTAAATSCAVSGTRTFTGLADGVHTFTVTVKTAENITASVTRNFKVVNAPTITLTTRPVTSTLTTATAAWTTVGQVDTTTCKLDAAAAASCISPLNLTGLPVGDHTLTVKVGNSLNAATSSDTVTWTVRPAICEAPAQLQITSPSLNTVAVICSGLSNLDQITLTTGAGSFTYYNPAGMNASLNPVGSTITWTDTQISITDQALSGATISDVTSRRIGGDPSVEIHGLAMNVKSPPQIAITAPGAASTVVAAGLMGTFNLTGGPASTVTCQIDAAPASACTSPVDLTALAAGAHTLTVAASGKGGAATPASVSFTVLGKPQVAISSPATGRVAAAGLMGTFALSGGAASSVTCSVDSAAAAPCVSPMNFSALTAGDHSLAVQASNAAGTDSAVRTFTIVSAPVVTISSPANGASLPAAGLKGSYSVSDALATSACTLDAAAIACAPGTQIDLSTLGTGTHILRVQASNVAGDVAASSTFTVVAPPQLQVMQPTVGQAVTDGSPLTVSFINTGGVASATCQIDTNAARACASGDQLQVSGIGGHTLTVTLTGAGGTSTATVAFSVAASSPNVQFSISENARFATSAGLNLVWTNSGSAIDSMTCYVYNGEFTGYDYQNRPCASPMDLTNLGEGNVFIYFEVIGVDGSYSYPNVSFNIGAAATVTIDRPNVTATQAGVVTVPFTKTDATYVQCSLHNSDNSVYRSLSPCTSPAVFTGVGSGTYTVEVSASNSTSSVSDTVQVSVKGAPNVRITSPYNGAIVQPTGTSFSYTLDRAADQVGCKLDGAPIACGAASDTAFTGPLGNLADGTHTLAITATNALGTTTSTVSFAPLGPAPTLTIDRSATSATSDGTITASFVAAHTAAVYCSVHNDDYSYYRSVDPSCTSPVIFTGVPAGHYTIEITAYDAGYRRSATDTVTVDIAAVPLTVTIDQPGITITSGTVTVPLQSTGAAYFSCSLHDASYSFSLSATCSSSAVFSNVPVGSYTFEVDVYDSSYSRSVHASAPVNVTVTTPPTATINSPSAGETVPVSGTSFSYRLDFAATAVSCTVDGIAVSCTNPADLAGSGNTGVLSVGSHVLAVTVTNQFGSRTATRSFTVAEPPKVTITSGPAEGASLRISRVDVSFTVTGNATSVTCSLNNQVQPSCGSLTGGSFYAPQSVSPYGYRWLRTDIPNTVSVTASNAVGMSTTVSRTFNVINDAVVTNADGITHHQNPDGFTSEYMTSYQLASGKIMVIGQYQTLKNLTLFPDLGEQGMYATRLNADMTTDTTFGTNGAKRLSWGNYDTQASAFQQPLAINHDDGSGYTYFVMVKSSDNRDHLIRVDANGDYDAAFGSPVVPTGRGDADYHTYMSPQRITVLADGRIMVSISGETQQGAIMVKADGTLDASFGAAGIAKFGSGANCVMLAAVQQADGKILIGGGCHSDGSVLERINPTDGSLDATFSAPSLGAWRQITRLDVAADGTITATGHEVWSAFLSTFTSTGSRIASNSYFSGKYVVTIGNTVTRDAQGRYVFAADNQSSGSCFPCSSTVGRVNAGGTLDTTFGTDANADGVVDGWMTLQKLAMAPYAVNETQELARIEGVLALADGRTVVYGWQGEQMYMRDILANGSAPA